MRVDLGSAKRALFRSIFLALLATAVTGCDEYDTNPQGVIVVCLVLTFCIMAKIMGGNRK